MSTLMARFLKSVPWPWQVPLTDVDVPSIFLHGRRLYLKRTFDEASIDDGHPLHFQILAK